jgi:uncharacterized protein YecT (DUF1311 family)
MKTALRHALVLCATGLAQAASAQTPAFDCAKAQGEVEKQICSDAALAALDRQLDTVYKAATAKATGKLATTLRSEQRGWVKGRNDCWKATQQTWITATWTVDTVKGCIDAQYRLRTSELQAVWRLLPPRTVAYACQGNPANELVLNFFASNPATLRMERGDRGQTLWQVGPPEAGAYEGQNVSLVQQGGKVTLNRLNTDTGQTEMLVCQAR